MLKRSILGNAFCYRAVIQGRKFSSPAALQSGHSRWSTIKHDKGKNDAAKNKQRSAFAKEIASASTLYGPDPSSNPRLALAIATAKKSGFPKLSIEAAIARGQGHSITGAALEPLLIEAVLPPAVATIIDCKTDNKLRTLQDVRILVKKYEGTISHVSHLFERVGRITLKRREGTSLENIFEKAIDEGALDVDEDDEARIIVKTEPGSIKAIEKALASGPGLDTESSDIIWVPHHQTEAKLEDEHMVEKLTDFVNELRQDAVVDGVYMNAAPGQIDRTAWSSLQVRLGPS